MSDKHDQKPGTGSTKTDKETDSLYNLDTSGLSLMSNHSDQKPVAPATDEASEPESANDALEFDAPDLALLPTDFVEEAPEILPGQFTEHDKTLKTLEEKWKRFDRRKIVRRQCPDRRQDIRFGGRDRRLAKFDRRRSKRGFLG